MTVPGIHPGVKWPIMLCHPLVLAAVSILACGGIAAAVGPGADPPPALADLYTYRIVNTFPHDPRAFTQGLVFHDGALYESTGIYGRSTLRKVRLETGGVIRGLKLAPRFFAEGLTIFKDRVIQLTWRSKTGFIYDLESLRLIDTFTYPTEGWGITHDGTHLILSDGSASLYFLDPENYTLIRRKQVFDTGGPVRRLNELEYIHDTIYANVWGSDRIAVIDPPSGRVTAWILLEGLLESSPGQTPVDVLNGIAYDSNGDRLFVTGKLWPHLFEIQLAPLSTPGAAQTAPQ